MSKINKIRAFLGTDPSKTEAKVEEIWKKWKDENPCDSEKRIYYASDFDREAFYEEISSSSLFSPRRFLVLRQVELFRKEEWDAILKALKYKVQEVEVVLEGRPSRSFPSTKFDVVRIESRSSSNIWTLFTLSEKEFYRALGSLVEKDPYLFPELIGACAQHLRLLLRNKTISYLQYNKKIVLLQDLDYRMKSGKISKNPGWELLFSGILDLRG
jgi:DNA polymerase III delta subunit